MPWCPKCYAEFRDGFTQCKKCGVALVDRLEQKSQTEDMVIKQRHTDQVKDNRFAKEVSLINTADVIELVYITSMLEEEHIPYRIIHENIGHYLEFLHGRSFFGKNVFVRQEAYEKAFAIVQSYKGEILPQDENLIPINDKTKNSYRLKVSIWLYLTIVLSVGVI